MLAPDERLGATKLSACTPFFTDMILFGITVVKQTCHSSIMAWLYLFPILKQDLSAFSKLHVYYCASMYVLTFSAMKMISTPCTGIYLRLLEYLNATELNRTVASSLYKVYILHVHLCRSIAVIQSDLEELV